MPGRCHMVPARCHMVPERHHMVHGRCHMMAGRCFVVPGRYHMVSGRCLLFTVYSQRSCRMSRKLQTFNTVPDNCRPRQTCLFLSVQLDDDSSPLQVVVRPCLAILKMARVENDLSFRDTIFVMHCRS